MDALPSSPRGVAEGFATAWNNADADALAHLFVEDADFVNVVGLWWTRREQIRYSHGYGFTHMFGGSHMEYTRMRVRELGPDAGMVVASWVVEGQVGPDGEPVGTRQGIFTFVTERVEGGWRAVSAQNTDIVPGVQTHVAGPDGSLTAVHYEAGAGASGDSITP